MRHSPYQSPPANTRLSRGGQFHVLAPRFVVELFPRSAQVLRNDGELGGLHVGMLLQQFWPLLILEEREG